MRPLLLRRVLPRLAAELEKNLREDGRDDLGMQVAGLQLVDRCRCGDHFCATIYTAPQPEGAYGPGHESIEVEGIAGWVVLDIDAGKIVCIEILYRPDVRAEVLRVLP